MYPARKFLRNIILVSIPVFVCIRADAQLSRKQIKRNNQRLMTYQGRIRNKFGSNYKYAAIGVSINALNYYGDLSPTQNRISTDISLTRPGLGFSYYYRIGPRLSVQTEFAHGVLKGSDNESANKNDQSNGVYRYNRNLSFRNRINELSFVAVVDFFKNRSFYTDRLAFAPYISFGVALIAHNPQAQVPQTDLHGNVFPNAGQWVNLRELGTEGQLAQLRPTDENYGNKLYARIQPAIPLGIGTRVRISQQIDVAADFSMRYLFTDYIDDVSKNYVDLGSFGNNELAKALSYRSNEIAIANERYTSEIDGKTYETISGYGQEHQDNKRGNKNDNDFYTVFSLRCTYIIENLPGKRPKYR